ncbi:unnamed protein product [Paramecium pentaurelia]|uniref:RING-type domain-containing protein n=1 Tax=Paramecium pentaurelia TaxID=43138 RepID=A0A8S1WV66_9CILI|nr:unnamed protein product [Paramecium pentaurelia]
MYQIIPISDTIKSRYPQLKDYYLCQFLGENKQSAIICSILHYLLNRRLSKSLEYFKSPRINYKSQQSQEITKILKDCMQMENPIQNFYEKLLIFDKDNLMTEVLLQDFCYSYQLTQNGQISLNSLADFLNLNIKIIPQFNILGRGNNDLIIIQDNEEYYFIIPEPQFQLETQVICFNCSRNVYVYMKPYCDHQICWNCLLKENQQCQMDDFRCRCGQVVLKQQIEQFQNEISSIAKTNHFNLLLEQFYHQQSSNLVLRKSTIRTNKIKQLNESIAEQFTASEIQASLLNETTRVLEQLEEVCCKCNKESNKAYFYLSNCTHKYCIDCISQEFSYNNCGGCYCVACPNKISRKEYEQYLQQINIDIKNIQVLSLQKGNTNNKCNNCHKIFSILLFSIANCKHSFCDTCLEQLLDVNYFLDYYCTVVNCNGTFKKQDYEKFKQEFRQKVQISYSELENSCNQISWDFNQLNQSKLCLQQFCNSQSEIKDQTCSKLKNPNLKSKTITETNSTKITLHNEQETNLNWSLLIDRCQQCLKQSQYQLFQVPLCNHKFCNSCIQNSIQNKQKDQKCPNKECKSIFTKRSYQNYYNNLLLDNEIINTHNIIQNQQQIVNQKQITQSDHLNQQLQKKNQLNLAYNFNALAKSSTNSTTDQQFCSFCNTQNETDQIFVIKCGHQICIRCSLRLKGENFRCSKCLTLFDNIKFKWFKQQCKYKCDNCQKIFPVDQILPNLMCRHFFCYQCLQSIYEDKKTIYCCVKSCNKIFNSDHILQFLKDLKLKEVDQNKAIQNNALQIKNKQFVAKQQLIQSNSSPNAQITTASLSILSDQSKYKQDVQEIKKIQSCMICNSDFDDYNQPVYFACNSHIIGICCILKNYHVCYICDKLI